ncbi:putative Condensin-2 complex subunit D3 [Hypsibius exemplaris]|uniref:Condensin-2 complex subunit D3 n=1 Tax=Hypsibius exemplaris TaxID=2072580 RepID=A0A1W0X3C7_HYPEX|nr:putative Condensin-2 complex subunit D3 [Hypsibius exemplaris]
MAQEEALNAAVEAFQALKYGEEFTEGMRGWVDAVYDAKCNLVDVPFADLQRELRECQVEDLETIATELLRYVGRMPAFGAENVGDVEINILTLLKEAGVQLKPFFAALTGFIYTALKSRSSNGAATRGCVSGAIYFLLLTATKGKVPAALHDADVLGLRSLFNQALYTKSLDILSLPDSWHSKKTTGKKGRIALSERQGNGEDEEDDYIYEVDTNVQWEKVQPLFLQALALFVRNMDLDTFPYHLARLCRTVADTWRRDYITHPMPFDASPRFDTFLSRNQSIAKCLSLVLSDSQTKTHENLEVVLWSLEPGILRISETLTSYQTLTKAVDTFAGHVTQFCLALIEKFAGNADCDEVIERFLQDIYYNVPDTADYRRRVAETWIQLLDVLTPDARNRLIRWMVEESDADRARGRSFALQVVQAMWTKEWNDVTVPYLKCTSKKAVILEVCIRRLRDKSSRIRGLAAAAMSSLLDQDPRIFDDLDGVLADELFRMVLTGISDTSVVARKASLQMLGRLLQSNFGRFNQQVMDCILRVAQDPAKSMRTSNIDVVCELMKSQEVSDDLVNLWNRVVFSLYMDSEQTVKDRMLEEFQTTILDVIMNDRGGAQERALAWRLLEKIAKDEMGEIRLLRQVLSDLEKSKAISGKSFNKVQEFIGTEWEKTAWMLLAELAPIVKSTTIDFAFDYVLDDSKSSFEGPADVAGACVFRIIQAAFRAGIRDRANERHQLLLKAFPKIKGVATVVEAVRAILAGFERIESVYDFNKWAEPELDEATGRLDGLLQQYEDWIRFMINSEEARNDPANRAMTVLESDIAFAVRVVAELGKHLGLGKDRNKDQLDFVVIRRANLCLQLLEKTCNFGPRQPGTPIYRPWVRAHGVFALGRICLGAKKLTWAHATKFVDLAHDKNVDVGLRRDAVMVVFDMLKMFGDVIEKDLNKVYAWLGDACSAIRSDVINHLHDLLLNEHIQWNPIVFYQFVTSISDPNPTIRAWVRSCLRSLMKKRNQCFTDFSEAVVFLNGSVGHPRFKTSYKMNNDGIGFPLKGPGANVERRLDVYAFMLKQMTDDQKRQTYARIVEQMLMPVVSREVKLEKTEEYWPVLLDVIGILGLKEMQFSAFIKKTGEEEEEDGNDDDEDADPEQQEDDAQRKQRKQTTAALKEAWVKFKQEVLQRSLLPVMLSIYRQLRNLPGANHILTALLKLVSALASEAELDLAEMAQSTSGFEGEILKGLALEIKRLEDQNTPAPPTPAPEMPATPAVDEIPLLRESPFMTPSDSQTAGPATTATVNEEKDFAEKAPERERDDSSEPPSPKKPRIRKNTSRVNNTTKNVAGRDKRQPQISAKEKIVEVAEEDEEEATMVEAEPDEETVPQRKTRRNVKAAADSDAEQSSSVGRSVKKAKKATVLASDSSSPSRSKLGMKASANEVEVKIEEPSSPPPARRPTRSTRRPVPEPEDDEAEDDQDDTVVEAKPKPKSKHGHSLADQTLTGVGAPRAISTPNKTRAGMADMTFGLDISRIDLAPPPTAHRTGRGRETSRRAANK